MRALFHASCLLCRGYTFRSSAAVGISKTRRALAIGTTVKVILQTDDQVEGIVLPGAAVVRGVSGLPQVWAKTGAERFKPLPVKTVALDGRQVLVIAGLGAGDRVVVEGAELINQVR